MASQAPTFSTPINTSHLPQTNLFKFFGTGDPRRDHIERAHLRAKTVVSHYKPTIDDILQSSEKFWNMHTDMMCSFDGGAVALWTIQLNLTAGTLAPFVKQRPELTQLMDDILTFRVLGHFMLTELGHGLDAMNLETEVTLLEDGTFDLHTPHEKAAKHMPPSVPVLGIPRVAVVFARLKLRGRDLGIRPFLVPINDGRTMCTGITSRPIPNQCGSKPIGFSITTFNHVKLPATALLGNLEPPAKPRDQFLFDLWRIGVGSIALTAVVIPGLKIGAYIVAEYSKRRRVTNAQGKVVPLISFRTQQAPIFHALSRGFVLDAFFKELRQHFVGSERTIYTQEFRNAMSTVFKTVAIRLWRETNTSLIDRCGAQGLFEHNQLISSEMEIRGVSVAEGDSLVLSIRLASELLLGRYTVPEARHESLLAQHELGIFQELRNVLLSFGGEHRTEQFNRRILPHAIELSEAIGLRMAYDAAKDAGVDPLFLRLFEIGAVHRDLSWYVEAGILKRQEAFDREEEIITQMLPKLEEYLVQTEAKPYAFAAITSDKSWDDFFATIPVIQGNASVNALHPLGGDVESETLRARL